MCEKWKLFENIEEDLSDKLKWWEVDENGNINYKGFTKTSIPVSEWEKSNVLTHNMKKDRAKGEEKANAEFYYAFMQAVKNAGYKKITIDVCNIHNPIIFE